MGHDPALVIENAAPHEAFVRRWVDADDEIEAIFDGISFPIVGVDLQLHVGVGQRKTRGDASQRDMRKHHRRAV